MHRSIFLWGPTASMTILPIFPSLSQWINENYASIIKNLSILKTEKEEVLTQSLYIRYPHLEGYWALFPITLKIIYIFT
jgi:hypothetical protein